MKAAVAVLALCLICVNAAETPHAPARLENGFGDFFLGVFKGFQHESMDSLCVIELKGVVENLDTLFSYISMIFSNYNNIFRSLNQFADFMDTLDLAVKSCEFSRLMEQIKALRDSSGRNVLFARIAIKSDYLIQAWKTFYFSLLKGAGEPMGIALGNILSVLLNFSI